MDFPADHGQKNDFINTQIFRQGPALFEAVQQAVLEKATVPQGRYDPIIHRSNQARLLDTIARVCADGAWRPDIGASAFWELAWGRITYQGTRADKASTEIERMLEQIALFADYRVYERAQYQFDKDEWNRFARHWKRRFGWYKLLRRHRVRFAADIGPADVALLASLHRETAKDDTGLALALWGSESEDWLALSRQWQAGGTAFTDWLSFAKAQGALWEQSLALFAHPRSLALAIMTKSGAYEGISFSAHAEKMVKYLALADFLKHFEGGNVLEHYTGPGYTHLPEHLAGERYRIEHEKFWEVHARFEQHFGAITALHLMMDLGFKTVKPDRVITYLFSQLGWLMSLPAEMSQKQVLEIYTKPQVVREVLYRADVLAAAVAAHASVPSAHRLLDIWFVKFGQEPEARFGITVKLEGKDGAGLKQIHEAVKERLGAQSSADEQEQLERRWPTTAAWQSEARKPRAEKAARSTAPRKTGAGAPQARMDRAQAEKIFVTTWRADLDADPRRYPSRIDNASKEAIIRSIQRGMPGDAVFSRVLGLDGGSA